MANNNNYSLDFIFIVALFLGSGNGMRIGPTSSEDAPSPGIVPERAGQREGCSCDPELKAMRERLEKVELTLEKYEKEQDRFYYLDTRIAVITKGILSALESPLPTPKNEIEVQGAFIQTHILDPQLLNRIGERIFSALSNIQGVTSEKLISAFELLLGSSAPSLHVPVLDQLLDHLGKWDQLGENLEKLVSLVKDCLRRSAETPTLAWTEEIQIKFIRRIVSQVRDWSSGFAFLKGGFFRSFPTVPELKAYDLTLEVMETQSRDTYLNEGELDFVKKLYYSSSYFQQCSSTNQNGDCNSTLWESVFLRSKVRSSIQDEILSRIAPNFTDASRIGISYFKTWTSLLEESDLAEQKKRRDENSDVLLSYARDVFLDAIQDGEMTYKSRDPSFFRLLQLLGKSTRVAAKYPFFLKEYRAIVTQKYGNNFTNFESIRGFLNDRDTRTSIPVQVWRFFIQSMKDNHRMNGNEAFQLGALLHESDREGDPIWEEMPGPIQTLFQSDSQQRDISWRVKARQNSSFEYFDITRNADHSIGLQRINSTERGAPGWEFQKYDPWYAYRRYDAYENALTGNLITFTIATKGQLQDRLLLTEVNTETRGVLGLTLIKAEDESQPPVSPTVFKPCLDPNLRTFYLSIVTVDEHMPMAVEKFLMVTYDEFGEPAGLGLTSKKVEKAEFMLSRN